jgi:hypothetical protein
MPKVHILGQNKQSNSSQATLDQPTQQIQLQIPDVQVSPQTASMIRQHLPQVVVGLQQQINQLQYTIAVFSELLVMLGSDEESGKKAADIVNLRMGSDQVQAQVIESARAAAEQQGGEQQGGEQHGE